MSPEELFKAGKLSAAIDAQLSVVKSKPGDKGARLFLFELMSFSGQWDRAQKQIDALSYDELELQTAIKGYSDILVAERARAALFESGVQPSFLAPPPEHVRMRLELLHLLRTTGDEVDTDAVSTMLGMIHEATPQVKATRDGVSFDGFSDADDILGGVLEVIGNGKYFWVPIEFIELLATATPRFPRDLLWLPARLETLESGGEVFIPTVYYGTRSVDDEEAKLGRVTDWKTGPGGVTRGIGMRTFLLGESAATPLELKELHLELATSE